MARGENLNQKRIRKWKMESRDRGENNTHPSENEGCDKRANLVQMFQESQNV